MAGLEDFKGFGAESDFLLELSLLTKGLKALGGVGMWVKKGSNSNVGLKRTFFIRDEK